MEDNPTQFEDYEVRDGVLFFKGKLLLDPASPLVNQVLQECHSTLLSGHRGIQKTTAKVCVAFTWPGVKKAVQHFVQECQVCQQMKPDNQKTVGLLQPLPIPQQIWDDIAMDFITCLPNSHGYTTIFVMVDWLSKQAHFGALPKSYTATKVADLVAQMVCKLHGLPRSITSDRDPIFLSNFWRELFTLSGTMLKCRTTQLTIPK